MKIVFNIINFSIFITFSSEIDFYKYKYILKTLKKW